MESGLLSRNWKPKTTGKKYARCAHVACFLYCLRSELKIFLLIINPKGLGTFHKLLKYIALFQQFTKFPYILSILQLKYTFPFNKLMYCIKLVHNVNIYSGKYACIVTCKCVYEIDFNWLKFQWGFTFGTSQMIQCLYQLSVPCIIDRWLVEEQDQPWISNNLMITGENFNCSESCEIVEL
jgi:hypothetical protein